MHMLLRLRKQSGKEEKIMAKRKSSNSLINAALYILVGLMLIVFRAQVLDWAMTAIGAVLIVMGLLNVIRGGVIEGALLAIIGIAIIVIGWTFIDIVLLVLGAALAIKGLIDLVRAASRGAVLPLVSALITTLVGVALFAGKWIMLDWFFIVIGAVLVLDGVLSACGKRS